MILLYQFAFKLSVSCLPSGRNKEQKLRRDHALLVSSVWFSSVVCCFQCVGYACAYGVRRPTFFQQQKKGSERGTTALAVQKCRSQTPRDWHSANRFCNSTTCVGLPSGLQDGCGLRDGLARCARRFCLMVFWDGIFAMASLNDCVRSRGSLAGNISHHIRSTKNLVLAIGYQFPATRTGTGFYPYD